MNLKEKANTYQKEYAWFREHLHFDHSIPEYRIEGHFESLNDWSLTDNLSAVESWFEGLRASCPMQIEEIPIKEVKDWLIDPQTGDISHKSGEFFRVCGLRTSIISNREVAAGWDQPIVAQIGLDGGLLGLIRQRIEGVPHYLIEAKLEPGNYKGYQLSPSLQATFSNLKRAHGGKKPMFAEYFEDPASFNCKVLYDTWLSEDGGRFLNKRNKGMLIELPSDHNISFDSNRFRWVSLFQIKTLLLKDAWINPHIRGIIAHI